MGDVDLVRQMLGTGTDQPPGRGPPQAIHMLECGEPQTKGAVSVELTRKQPLVRGREVH